VAGEGLAGVLVAALVATGVATKSHPPRIGGAPGEVVTLLLLAGLCVFLAIAGGKSRRKPRE
jgi:hypothetical protein